MQIDTLEQAIYDAKRFLEIAAKVPIVPFSGRKEIRTGKEAAACKRASLDLTRALSALRKP